MAHAIQNGKTDRSFQQAKLLAKENLESDSSIVSVYWFPHADEVRLVEVDLDQFDEPTVGGRIQPFYFRASPADELPLPTAVALISREDVGKLEPPEGWGDWQSAMLLEARE